MYGAMETIKEEVVVVCVCFCLKTLRIITNNQDKQHD